MKRSGLMLLAVALAALLPACGAPMGTFSYRSDVKLNCDEEGKTNSVRIRIYMLKSQDAFMNTPLAELDKALAEVKVGEVKEFDVQPGQPNEPVRDYALGELKGDFSFIGVLALYQDNGKSQAPKRAVVTKEDVNKKFFFFTEYTIAVRDK